MKLRNKKTGQIVTIECITLFESTTLDDTFESFDEFYSLTKLNEEWEDYEPKEPIIKDEKVRRAVRAWAEANGLFEDIEIHSLAAGTRFSIGHYDIEFMGYFIYDLERNKTYNIDELCGEKEQ